MPRKTTSRPPARAAAKPGEPLTYALWKAAVSNGWAAVPARCPSGNGNACSSREPTLCWSQRRML